MTVITITVEVQEVYPSSANLTVTAKYNRLGLKIALPLLCLYLSPLLTAFN